MPGRLFVPSELPEEIKQVVITMLRQWPNNKTLTPMELLQELDALATRVYTLTQALLNKDSRPGL